MIKIPKPIRLWLYIIRNPLAKARTSKFRYLNIEISVYYHTDKKYTACDLSVDYEWLPALIQVRNLAPRQAHLDFRGVMAKQIAS